MGRGGFPAPPRVKPSEITTAVNETRFSWSFGGYINSFPLYIAIIYLFLFRFEFYFYSDSNFNKYLEPCPAPVVFMLCDAHCFQTSRSRAAHVAQHEDDWGRISQEAVWALNEHNRECENKITQIFSKEFRADTCS